MLRAQGVWSRADGVQEEGHAEQKEQHMHGPRGKGKGGPAGLRMVEVWSD